MSAGLTPLLRLVLGLERAVPALPRRLAQAAHRRMGAPPERFGERLGRASLARPAGRLLWVHAASVGEAAASRDLAGDLAREAGAALLFTTTTLGGAGAVPAGALHQFAPIDAAGAVRGFLDHWKPDLGVLVEAELWPRLVLEASARMPLALVNARASRTRRRAPRSAAALLRRFAVVTAQDEAVAGEIRALGLPHAEAVGDLRASASAPAADEGALAGLRAGIATRPVWAAVSTHEADEAAVAGAARAVRERHPGAILLWAPRHPARADAIAAAVPDLQVARRSLGGAPGHGTDVLLFDTLGETGLVFRLAPLAVLGGGWGPEGGHNPWEPARLGCAVLSGPGVANHREGFKRLVAERAARIVAKPGDLGDAVAGLLGTPAARAMGEAGARVAAEGGRARERTLALLLPLLAGGGAGS